MAVGTSTKMTNMPAAKPTDRGNTDAEPKTLTKTVTGPGPTNDTYDDTEEESKETDSAGSAASATDKSPVDTGAKKEHTSASLTTGAKADIAVSVICLVSLVAGLTFLWRRKKK